METKRDLLSDASTLAERKPTSTVPADNEIRDVSTEQAVRESLLSTRLHLPFLARTDVRPSTIDGAGRGLFATEDIPEGDVITCYPGDALLHELPSGEDGEEGDWEEEDYDDESTDIVLWGSHVSEEDRWDEETVFDGTESTRPLTEYCCWVDDSYSIMGEPKNV